VAAAARCDILAATQVELILVELEDDNSYKTKFSAGWAQVTAVRCDGTALLESCSLRVWIFC
jgi:hypothetical protein